MTQREEILKIQKASLEQIKEEIKKNLGPQSKEIKKYYKEYKKIFQQKRQCSSKKELLTHACRSDILFCGDYHTLQHSQHTFLTIAEEVLKKRGNIVIGLEMVHNSHQHTLNSYLAGTLSEKEFLDKIDYIKSWGFNWNNYRPLFQFAIDNNIRILALNSGTKKDKIQLPERDRFAAQLIADEFESSGNTPILVLFGDLHIAPNHLPAKTLSSLKKKGLSPNIVLVYQNSETLFWYLEEQEANNEVDVVKIDKNAYSIQSVPPWIKLQSYLTWMEQGEDFFCSSQESSLFSRNCPEEFINFTDEIFIIIKKLTQYLNIQNISTTNFQVYTLKDCSFLASLDLSYFGKSVNIVKMLSRNKGFFFPEKNIIYLSRIDINYASEEAGQYLHHQLSGGYKGTISTFDAFYCRAISEAIGFFCSMLINPKRKVSQLPDYTVLLSQNTMQKRKIAREKKVAEYILKHDILSSENIVSNLIPHTLKKISPEDVRYYFHISNELGHIVGSRLYHMHINDIFTKKEFLELLKTPLSDRRVAFRLFMNLWVKTTPFRPKKPQSRLF